MRTNRTQKGSVLIVTLVFVAVFGALAVGYLAASNGNLESSRLYAHSRRAHFASEMGLELARRVLPEADVAGTTTYGETLAALAAALNNQYQATLFQGAAATVQSNCLTVPALSVTLPEGTARTRMMIYATSHDDYYVWSEGTFNECRQTLRLRFRAERDMSLLTTFGVASKSRIRMLGNARIIGLNDPKEGSVLSTTMVTLDPIDITGHVLISGDAAITNPAGTVSYKGNSNIQGDIRIGVREPPFPAVDTSIFEPYATTIVDASTNTSSDCYLENVRIVAGTNPMFSGRCTIRGVVYIESPNEVRFAGGADIIGVIVVEPPTNVTDFAHHNIVFNGNCSAQSVSQLPDLPQFAGLRSLDGSFLLAPGYEVHFLGNFGTIGGSIYASKMDFSGTTATTVRGSVLNCADTDFTVGGTAGITIDHTGISDPPAGMIFPRVMKYAAGSYLE
jgi:Tfp pilus assembly protein PilX